MENQLKPWEIDEFGEGSLFLNKPKAVKKPVRKVTITGFGSHVVGPIGILFNIGPKHNFNCHECGHKWKERLQIGIDEPTLKCPSCKVLVQFKGQKWSRINE